MGRYSAVAPEAPLYEGNKPCLGLGAAGQALSQGQERGKGSAGGQGVCGNSRRTKPWWGGQAQPGIRLLFLAHFLRKRSTGAPAPPGSPPASVTV